MAKSDFESLRVYRLSETLADRVWGIATRRDALNRHTLGRQIIRAADSIGANIAEGRGRGSYNDNKRFVRIARGSLHETQHWLRRAYQRKLLTKDEIDELKQVIDNLHS